MLGNTGRKQEGKSWQEPRRRSKVELKVKGADKKQGKKSRLTCPPWRSQASNSPTAVKLGWTLMPDTQVSAKHCQPIQLLYFELLQRENQPAASWGLGFVCYGFLIPGTYWGQVNSGRLRSCWLMYRPRDSVPCPTSASLRSPTALRQEVGVPSCPPHHMCS